MTCKHEYGDFIDGGWACGQCWRRVDGPLPMCVMEDGTIMREFVADAVADIQESFRVTNTAEARSAIVNFVLMEMEMTGVQFGDPNSEWRGDPVRAWAVQAMDESIDMMERHG